MKIALIGATGFVGSKVLAEALQRGHQVTALVRSPGKLSAQEGLAIASVDATDPTALAHSVQGHDALVSAYNGPRGQDDFSALYLKGTRSAIQAAKQTGVR